MHTRGAILLTVTALLIAAQIIVQTSPVRAAKVSFMLYQGTNCPGTSDTLCFGDGRQVNPTLIVNQGDTVNITVHNNDTINHVFQLSAPYSLQSLTNTPGQTQWIQFTAGTAEPSPGINYICTIDSHGSLGMLGKFIVTPTSSSPISPLAVLGLVLTAASAACLFGRRR